ncbi:hypothetical protein HX021_13470 [Sphingobacterium sp. N143]|uniref:hypothetical protein n=1 Tax=Sphingobacterium sp. N143 TaxID=2746727 RepID=UPI0025753488|nr:hypothetical protein [Sphingobacterium sp. N143]MDM1295292.1 hypothetical protein [Sphingobacterium sp. N143]
MQFNWKAAMLAYTEKDWREFVFFSANMQHLLGICNLDIQQNLHRAVINFSNRQAEVNVFGLQFDGKPSWLPPPEKPGFILTFHFGYYRAVPAFLLQLGYKLCIPVAEEIIDQQMQYYKDQLGDSWQQQVIFLKAEDPYLFFKLRRQMDRGYHVFCYLDGGLSAAKDAARYKLKEIQFLNGRIAVQHGILDMAHLLGKNLTILIAEIPLENNPVTIRTLDHCPVNWFPNRQYFTDYFIRVIYEDFEEVLLGHPEAWEAWLYLHKTMSPSSDESRWGIDQRIILFKNADQHLLLDKFTYLSYALPLHVTNKFLDKICFDRDVLLFLGY